MNIEKAMEAVSNGRKVTHPMFEDGEFVQASPGGLIAFDDGAKCEPDKFWTSNPKSIFADGWELL